MAVIERRRQIYRPDPIDVEDVDDLPDGDGSVADNRAAHNLGHGNNWINPSPSSSVEDK